MAFYGWQGGGGFPSASYQAMNWNSPANETTTRTPGNKIPPHYLQMMQGIANPGAALGVHDRPDSSQQNILDQLMAAQGNGGGMSPLEQILQMWGATPNGMSQEQEQSLRREAVQQSPYTQQIQDIRRQIAQTSAQSQQNVADIHSWFGQYAGQLKGTAKGNRKAGKAALKGQGKDSRALLGSGLIGDKALRQSVAGGAADERRYLRDTNLSEANFDRRQIADASRQEAYQALIQSRLGGQAQADLQSKIPALRNARKTEISKAISSGNDAAFQRWSSILGMLPQETRAELLGFPQAGSEDPQEEARSRLYEDLDRLGETMSGINPSYTYDNPQNPDQQMYGSEYSNFNDLLRSYEQLARGSGVNLDDPAIREAFRAYIGSLALEKWNPYARQQENLTPMRPVRGGFVPEGGR